MVISDNFAQGMAYLLIFTAGLLFLAIVIEIPVLFWILKRTTNRNSQLAILAVALLPGYVFFMNLGGPAIALAFIGPVITLIPLVVRPVGIGQGSRLKQILLVYGAVILFEMFLLFAFMQISVYWDIALFRFNPAFNTALYAVFAILDLLFACAVYRIMQASFPVQKVIDDEPA